MARKGLRYLGNAIAGYALGLALLVRKKRPENARDREFRAEARKQLHPASDRPQGALAYLKRVFQLFSDDDCLTTSAAIAYYTVFSLPPLLLLVIGVAGLVFGREVVQQQLQQQIAGLIGADAAGQVGAMVEAAGRNRSSGMIGAVAGGIVLLFGATGAMAALQDALNKTWHVKPDPNAAFVRTFIGKRVLSFLMILGIGFLLLVSLAVSAGLAAFGTWVGAMLPEAVSGTLLQIVWVLLSLAVITVLFAAMFKFLPDAAIQWRDVWVGAALTSVLFTGGKSLIGIYLGRSGAASAYGAAGSLVLIVLWIYYASIILLIGAELTKVWSSAHGRPIRPEPGAVRVVTTEQEA
jgi:membrane protein